MSPNNRGRHDGGTSLIHLSPEAQRAFSSLQEMAARAAVGAPPALAIAAHVSASLVPLHGVLHDIATKLRPSLESRWLESFQHQIHDIAKASQALEAASQAVDTAMRNAESIGRMGWTFPMNASLREFVDLLLVVPSGPEATNAAFARFYTENKKESLLLLLAHLRQHDRIAGFGELLEEIAFGLDHEKYRLAVTALIPFFEGIARRCWVDGFWKTKGREAFFKSKVASSALDSFDRVVWSATRAFVERLYEHNGDGDPKPLVLNRHWILHGRGPADASLIDAIRLLQGIHTVASLADEEARDAAEAAQAG